MKLLFLDFEFTDIREHDLELVSCAAKATDEGYVTFVRNFWLYKDKRAKAEARAFFEECIKRGYVFVAYVLEAEARSLLTLFQGQLPPIEGIDLYLEHRQLLNHNHAYAYGEQYIDGEVITTTPPLPKWERLEKDGEDTDSHHKPSYSLAAAVFKLLGKKIDTEEKDEVRGIIIKGEKISENQERIQKYNASDIEYLSPLLNQYAKLYLTLTSDPSKQNLDTYINAAKKRAEYSVLSAKMIRRGYPINMKKVDAFTSNINSILESSIVQCLETAPDVKAFRKSKKDGRYSLNEKAVRDWVETQGLPNWRMTDGGKSGIKKLSLSKDAFSDYFSSDSEGFGGAFVRHLKTKQSLNGFIVSPNSKRGVFKDFVGSDNRVRPNFGIYGSQASRSQPGSVGFIPLKAHWMRNFIEAPAGKALCGLDYASQEFLVAAIMSQDNKMIDAYESGDVYLSFGKDAGLIPKEGTKSSHKKERDMCKTVVLGISYDLSAMGLAPRLSQITGQPWTVEKAESLIDIFYEIYSDYWDWKQEIRKQYLEEGYLQLCDGWTMWGDNDNMRSVGNFPVQGTGAVIMREAVRLCEERDIEVIYTLHDALYSQFDSFDVEKVGIFLQSMQEAFCNTMRPFGRISPIRIEGEIWSADYEKGFPKLPECIIPMREYIDDKGKKDLERYSRYFAGPISKGAEHGV